MYSVLRGRCGGGHFFFFSDTATTEIYTLSLHDALPIYVEKSILRYIYIQCIHVYMYITYATLLKNHRTV